MPKEKRMGKKGKNKSRNLSNIYIVHIYFSMYGLEKRQVSALWPDEMLCDSNPNHFSWRKTKGLYVAMETKTW